MEQKLLGDSKIYPSSEMLKAILGRSYAAYEELRKVLSSAEWGLNYEWRYYNDYKSWLCKVTRKKKTVFWLSAWDKYFKISIYFIEKTIGGIPSLQSGGVIPKKAKGKFVPVIYDIKTKKQTKEVITIARYKMRLK